MSVDRFITELGGRRHDDYSSRVPIGCNLGLSLLLACLAVALRDPLALALLGGANLFYLLLNRAGWRLLWQAGRILLWQSLLLALLHYLRFGVEGLLPALRISWQLVLAFLPGTIFLRSSSRAQLSQLANSFLPPTAAFVLSASLHFLPLLVAELKALYQVQLLRGARISLQDICKPWCWSDLVTCLLVPATVQALALAGEISLAARVRDFGVVRQRTCWPGTGSKG